MAVRDENGAWVTDWGQGLGLPVPGYLEASGGPIPIRYVDWVELSTWRLKGGLAGRLLERIDAAAEVLSELRNLSVTWELRSTTWSVEGILREEPIQTVHLPNRLGPTTQADVE